LASAQGDFLEAQRLLEATLRLSRQRWDARAISRALSDLANVRRMQGDREAARELYKESLAIGREFDDKEHIAAVLRQLPTVGGAGPDPRAVLEESLQICRQLGDHREAAGSLNMLGIHYYYSALSNPEKARTLLDEARSYLEESIAIHRALGVDADSRFSLIHLAHVAVQERKYAEARTLLREALTFCRARGEKRLIVECLEGFAAVAANQTQPERAARLLGAAASVREVIGFRNLAGPGNAALAGVRDALDPAAFTAAWTAGHALTWQQAADYAMEDKE
jgi:tetratricopeptide (TPR) repeat protein